MLADEDLSQKMAIYGRIRPMIPKLIHQTSRSKLLTPEEERLVRRIKTLMPDWKINLWDDNDNIEILNKAFPEYCTRFMSIKRGVMRADIARCVYLYLFGGLYIDTDYKMLRPIGIEILKYPCVLPVSRSDDPSSPLFRICNSVIASEARHPFWEGFLNQIFSFPDLENLPESVVEKVTGPEGLTKFYLANRSQFPEVFVPPRKFFHPQITYRGLSFDRSYPSYGAHLCWGSWRSKGMLRGAKTFITRKLSSF
jgi:mannosyltransferase OCH1-like enzyme